MSLQARTLSIFVALWIANVVIATTWHFNPLFCWGGVIVGPVWKGWSEVAFLCSIGFFIFAMFTGWYRVPLTIGAMMLVGALPQFMYILTGGGSCGALTHGYLFTFWSMG